jgi:hypothetical protein
MSKVHRSVTVSRVLRLANESMLGSTNPGICLACGERADGVEPDARRLECECCGESKVYGAEELLFIIG